MNYMMPHYATNSGTVHELAISSRSSPISVFSTMQYRTETQSPSVTASGYLWKQALAQLISNTTPTELLPDVSKTEIDRSAEQMQKTNTLIQLLKSWREGDLGEAKAMREYQCSTPDPLASLWPSLTASTFKSN